MCSLGTACTLVITADPSRRLVAQAPLFWSQAPPLCQPDKGGKCNVYGPYPLRDLLRCDLSIEPVQRGQHSIGQRLVTSLAVISQCTPFMALKRGMSQSNSHVCPVLTSSSQDVLVDGIPWIVSTLLAPGLCGICTGVFLFGHITCSATIRLSNKHIIYTINHIYSYSFLVIHTHPSHSFIIIQNHSKIHNHITTYHKSIKAPSFQPCI